MHTKLKFKDFQDPIGLYEVVSRIVVSVNSVSSFKPNISKKFMEFLIEIGKAALRPPDTGVKVTDVLLTSSIYRIQGKVHGNNTVLRRREFSSAARRAGLGK